MGKWFPDRKIWASGLAGLIAFAGTTVMNEILKMEIAYDTALEITIFIMGAVAYFIPPTTQDILKRVDEKIIELSGKEKAGN